MAVAAACVACAVAVGLSFSNAQERNGFASLSAEGWGKHLLGAGLQAGLRGEPALKRGTHPASSSSSMARRAVAARSTPRGMVGHYDLSAHQTLSRVILLIRENYVEPGRVKPYDMFLAALDYVQKTVPEVIVDDAAAPKSIRVAVGSTEKHFALGNLSQLWEVTMALRDIFRFIQIHLDDSEKHRDIEYAAINGMLSTLDPHSILLRPESFDEVRLSTKGEFGGLGIVISIRDGALAIISPIEGTPASRAGLRAKDKIVKIGEESTINMSLEEAVQRLRGKAGTKVKIGVMRQGWSEARPFILERAVIKIESVTSKLLDDDVGYVRIKSFQNNTYDDLNRALAKLKNEASTGLRGLILDLRNNPGGLLDQAILISDRFIPRGPLVITVGEGHRTREVKRAHRSGTEREQPIVVLVNGGSASASEIVSGALKNHDRAVVVGQQTFGKGSVQVLYELKDRSALKLTIAQYLTPGDISIQSVGIVPDVALVPATLSKDRIHLFVDPNLPREKDLEKHLDIHRNSQVAEVQQPEVRLTHWVEDNDDGDGAGEDAKAETKTGTKGSKKGSHANADVDPDDPNAFREDFEIRLAHKLLLKAPSPHRKEMLAAGAPLFDSLRISEQARIAARFDALGADWRPGPKDAPSLNAHIAGDLKLEIQLAKTQTEAKKPVATKSVGSAQALATAGEAWEIRATLHNRSKHPLYRAYAVSASDNPWLRGLEFVFGHVPAGASKSWSVSIKLPDDEISRLDKMTLTLGSSTLDAPDLEPSSKSTPKVQAVAFLGVKPQAKPRFAYTYAIDDRASGNGDGRLQVGEEVVLNVYVGNRGRGAASDALVTLKNLSDEAVLISRGRENIGELLPNEHKTGHLSFTVQQEVESVSLRLGILDATAGTLLADELVLPVLPALDAKLGQAVLGRTLHVESGSKKGLPVYAAPDVNAKVLGVLPAGKTVDLEWMFGDWRRLGNGLGFVNLAKDSKKQAKALWTINKRTINKQSPKGQKTHNDVSILERKMGQSAPEIILEIPQKAIKATSLRLRGRIQDEEKLHDVYVFVRDKKVYYRNLNITKNSKRGASAGLDIELPLEPGANLVVVVVRESEMVVGRRVFSIFQDGLPAANKQDASSL